MKLLDFKSITFVDFSGSDPEKAIPELKGSYGRAQGYTYSVDGTFMIQDQDGH